MRKEAILIILICFLNLVSAAYECSDKSTMTQDQKEIVIKDRETINNLGVGLFFSDETLALNRYSAELIIDAKKFTLTNETPLEDIELISGTNTVTLLNLTSNQAKIDVEGDSESVGVGEIKTINSLIVFVTNAIGEYPGEATVEGIIGKEKIILSNDISKKVITLENIDYLLELFSASDNNAIVKVGKCENENASIIISQDEEINNSIGDANETVEHNQTGSEQNESLDIQNETANVGEDITQKNLEDGKSRAILVIVIIIGVSIALLLVIILIRKIKSNNAQETQEIKSDYPSVEQE
ncbi:MAG: hypothetical protein KKF67_01150 [Nanoarchaeota archaeon]|nr:hypothetical protein [Nanoarchaeota archaeon]